MTNMKIRNILWYVNGTLFDTIPAITYSFSKALTEMGFSVALNVIDGLVRQSNAHCVETLSRRFKLDPSLLHRKFLESYQTVSPANQPPFPGAREVCEFIHRNGGLNIAVTDSSLASALNLLEAHQLSDLIDETSSLDQGNHGNLIASSLPLILEKHFLVPQETLVISSRENDLQAIGTSGIRTCLMGKVEQSMADLRIENYGQLLELMNGGEGYSSERRHTNET
jgi:phosphoglycolate phosphatase-like HAD superfamily hydrolase